VQLNGLANLASGIEHHVPGQARNLAGTQAGLDREQYDQLVAKWISSGGGKDDVRKVVFDGQNMTSSWATHEDIGSGDVFEALHSGLTVELISTHRDDLRTCTLDDAIADVIGRNTESYDFLPVVSLASHKDASILGLFHAAKFSRAASLEGCVRDHYDPLSEEFVIGADARILDFIKDADHKPCRLVVSNSGIVGLVSWSDLQRLPVRAVLFAVITGFEITMMEVIKRRFKNEEHWLCCLNEGRQQKIKDTIAESRRDDAFVDALLFTQFCDKADIIRKSFDLGGSKPALTTKLKEIQRLRDHVAHANEYATSPEQARKVCSLVRDILVLRETLAGLRMETLLGKGE
jgi:hypothetical protein